MTLYAPSVFFMLSTGLFLPCAALGVRWNPEPQDLPWTKAEDGDRATRETIEKANQITEAGDEMTKSMMGNNAHANVDTTMTAAWVEKVLGSERSKWVGRRGDKATLSTVIPDSRDIVFRNIPDSRDVVFRNIVVDDVTGHLLPEKWKTSGVPSKYLETARGLMSTATCKPAAGYTGRDEYVCSFTNLYSPEANRRITQVQTEVGCTSTRTS